MVKIVTFFLIAIAGLALAGRLFRTRKLRKDRPGEIGTFRKCRDCGKYRLAGSVCDCGARG